MSTVDTHYEFKLRNTKPRDSGEYCVQVGKFSRKMHLKIKEIPREISADERNAYMDPIKSGEEVRQYVRIQVIGKDRVGKTSLVHRLLFLDEGKYKGKSTDGIDINRKCQIRTSDGEWIVGEVDTEKEIIKRILQAANIKQRGTDPVSELSLPIPADEKQMHSGQEPIQIKEKKIGTKTFNEHDETPNLKDETQYASNTSAVSSTNLEENKLNMGENVEKQNNPDQIADSFTFSAQPQHLLSDKNDHITEAMKEKFNDLILYARAKKEKMTSEGLIECGIWDFAGQKDYYASHQTFFTPHAIYLLVADINEEIKAIKHDEELDFDSVGDYIDFWLDSIHCFCKDLSAVKLCPPVILVCTGIDKIEKNVDFKTKYNEKFQKVFGGQRKADHSRGIYFISNTEFLEEDFKEIKRLRKYISEIAKQMNYFAEKLPTRWIQLENALGVLKGANEHVLLFKNMKIIARKYLIEEEELLRFLNNQHKIGNLIFFKEIRELIILQPEWLVKCYRCLVCDCHPEKRNFNMICPTAWYQLISTGQLSNTLINQLFEKEPALKFEDHQSHLLKVMEKCDIIVKPQFTDSSNNESHTPDVYYLPCMIEKSASYNSIKETFISNNSNVSITPWLVLEFEFLPLAYFNHILFHYIRNFDVCKLESESPAIYRGKSVFYIDTLRKFIICFSHNAISLQIWEWDDVRDRLYQNVLNQLCDIIESIKRKLDQNINYSIKAKCNSGNYSKSAGRISFNDLTERDIYMCEEHNCTHIKATIENTWLKHAVEREERNIIRKEPEIALQESLGADQVKAENKEERNIIRKEPEIALQETLAADTVKAEGEERNIIRKEPEIALQESLGADQVKAEGEERNIIRKEPEIALQESLGADKVNAEREESNMIYTRKEPEITLHESFGADKMKAYREEKKRITNEPEIAFQESLGSSKATVRVLVSAGNRGVSTVNKETTGTASLARFTKEEINFTKMGMIVLNILADVLYDLLKQDKPNLRPRSDVDITYLYSEHRKLNKHIPSNLWGGTWQTIQNTDIAIGDDIERIRLTRNELQHSRIFELEDKRFGELCYIISDLLKRFDGHNKPTMLYADRVNEILTKTLSKEEVISIENEIMGMTIEVIIEH
ncbi:uncharacterized protein LOC143083515 [Mytilus galloprovincialis]|uniref:uncharacterized protein LOC143083515 n=1 Tax=Mytilus galloprovincialis TaxID=29158 RepID=UPI003F7BCCC1